MKKKKSKSPQRRILEEKRRVLTNSVFDYWKEQDELNLTLYNNLKELGIHVGVYEPLPFDLSSFIYLLDDGAVFIRFKTENCIKGMHTIISNDNIDSFVSKGLIIPIRNYNIVIPSIRVVDTSFKNTTFHVGDKEYFVEYLIYNHIKYDDENSLPTLVEALLDFRLTLLGINFDLKPENKETNESETTKNDIIEKLKLRIKEFNKLLISDVNEEALQVFLKENPYLLKISSAAIPKQKLGEDFVTDFVLVNLLDKGKIYTFVELEKSTHKILTKDGALSSEVNKALKQVNDWNNWLEKNKNYLQSKLPNLETPKFLIVIGRSNEMSDTVKEKFRSYCRSYSNIDIMSYDDLVSQANEMLESIEKMIA